MEMYDEDDDDDENEIDSDVEELYNDAMDQIQTASIRLNSIKKIPVELGEDKDEAG